MIVWFSRLKQQRVLTKPECSESERALEHNSQAFVSCPRNICLQSRRNPILSRSASLFSASPRAENKQFNQTFYPSLPLPSFSGRQHPFGRSAFYLENKPNIPPTYHHIYWHENTHHLLLLRKNTRTLWLNFEGLSQQKDFNFSGDGQ